MLRIYLRAFIHSFKRDLFILHELLRAFDSARDLRTFADFSCIVVAEQEGQEFRYVGFHREDCSRYRDIMTHSEIAKSMLPQLEELRTTELMTARRADVLAFISPVNVAHLSYKNKKSKGRRKGLCRKGNLGRKEFDLWIASGALVD